MKHTIRILAVLALATTAVAQDLTVDEIVDRALWVNTYQGQDGRARVRMTITDSQGRERSREMIILRRDQVSAEAPEPDETFLGDQKFYVYFQRPSDVRKMAFLVWKHVGTDDDRWLYLPSLDLVKRIASTEERTSFVGTHFFYEDVSGRNKDEDTHELEETTENFYVLKSTPNTPAAVEFAYYRMWIHRGTFVVTQTVYYDVQNKPYREYKALKVETVQGFPTVVQAKMSDERIGGATVIDYTDVRYDQGQPDDIFTERYLRQAPMKYLR